MACTAGLAAAPGRMAGQDASPAGYERWGATRLWGHTHTHAHTHTHTHTQVDDVIVALDESLRPAANGVAHGLRRLGRRVELVLEPKKMKWAFKVRLLLWPSVP